MPPRSNDKVEDAPSSSNNKGDRQQSSSPSSPPASFSLWNSFHNNLRKKDVELKDSATALFFVESELTRVDSNIRHNGRAGMGSSASQSLGEEDSLQQQQHQQLAHQLPQRWIDFFCIIGVKEIPSTILSCINTTESNKQSIDCKPHFIRLLSKIKA